MMELRKYTISDGDAVVSWITDERAFRLWCADRFGEYPLSPEVFNGIYSDNGENLQGIIVTDGDRAVGHFFVQPLGEGNYKFGLIIVDSSLRGMGYGRKMLEAGLRYAKEHLNAKRVVLSAFDTNPAAYNCYKRLGFQETGRETKFTFFDETHNYVELEYVF